MSEAKEAPKGLQALFSRPRKFYEKVESGTVAMTSAATELVYVRECRDCELRATTKLAKCIIDSCSNVKVALEEPIMSGTLEMIDCKNVSVLINPRDSLPTISAERCESIRFHLVRPGAMGSVYSVQCRDVSVHFKPPHREEYVLELPGGGVEEGGRGQFVSYLSGENMVTERVVREGSGYATTATKLAEAEKKQKELMRRFEEHVVKMLGMSGPTSTTTTSYYPCSSSAHLKTRDSGRRRKH
ncbi:hypothetical protein GBAR_LOCUS7342 [Geodia barretti]|uniref:C-CAP/cofactor C-like domain-containing protein n=1 Tax=Geodia barretti TaxID=519541 RepID=A0AA35RJR4_GEOBA|nr:hypothetical protein GBAR_LOCUS7342 [Geodia barretti]